MLNMKLPQRKSKHKASDEEEDEEERLPTAGICSEPCTGPAGGSLQREAVYEWFVQCLGPAERLEMACGLMDLCNPLELRFLGSCLEDLARKDCHYLRDCESRANGLGGESSTGIQQGDLSDPTTRSRLIVYLALLNSENREMASRLYRLLLSPAAGVEELLGCWEQEDERDPEDADPAREELLLLFTMASLHPAFSFHQRLTLREQLERFRESMHDRSRLQENVHEYLSSTENRKMENSAPAHNGVTITSHKLQREAVHIEKITFKGVQRKRADKNLEYTFKVTWSDLSVTSVTKSHQELLEFLLMLPKELSSEAFDKTILHALNLGSQKRDDRRSTDLEPIIRQIFSSQSQTFLQNQRVHKFFQVSIESGRSHNNLLAPAKACKNTELFKEDSSEASSQDEDVLQHMTIHKKCPVSNTVAPKSSPLNRLHMQHCEQNGGMDWRKKASPESPHHEHYKTSGHQHIIEKGRSFGAGTVSSSERNVVEKIDSRSVCRANGNKSAQVPRTGVLKDTDSNSEDSTKNGVSRFSPFGTVNPSPSGLSAPVSYRGERVLDESVNTSKFPHIPILPALHCVVHNGAEKMETVISPTIATDMKAVGALVSSVSMSPGREAFHQCTLGLPSGASPIGESEKHADILTSSLHGSPAFLPRNCQPSNPSLHLPIHRLKMPSQGQSETCTVNGSTQTGLSLGSPNAGFVSAHSPGGFPATVSDSLSKPVSQVVGLNQGVPHIDANVGTMPPPTNLKLVLPANNISQSLPSVPYNLSGAPLAGVLAAPNTNVLNSSAVPPQSQPTNVVMGQVQAAIPPAVPTHTPGPAPSPSPALTHSTAQSDSTSFISTAVGNTSTNGSIPPPQQLGPGPCGSCGRRCGCGNAGGVPMGSYYYTNPLPGQVYRVNPFFSLPSICNGTYLNQAHQSSGTQLPFFLHQAPYTNGLMHDPVLGGQANYAMQQIPGFPRFYSMYPAPNVLASSNGSGPKKNGNISCYNCGLTGHIAQDCKQPPMDANQQGIYRLRFASPLPPSHDTLDSAD
ncbi:zinc finger CCHC domain-containing protein 2 isoform X2 [Spea bombifrons]|uniref:zinc finger CCHC domain-containing protein 2 isoform X2 n=1 Tax=Spea bombifrons TaxID=233779 RepID=UPI00234B8BFC|nr:zinc finger CCHC domain-containing protein 2 isoform X2 [Spea bombifrons]